MKHLIQIIVTSFFMLNALNHLIAQDNWILKKAQNDIQVYISQQENNPFVKYKAETIIPAHYIDVYKQVVNFEDNKQFLQSVAALHIIERKPMESFTTYMQLDLPWPVNNRDLLTQMIVKQEENHFKLISNSISEPVKEHEDFIRIKNFYEEWHIAHLGENLTSVSVSGWADPGGAIPAWIVNLFVVEEPYAFLKGIKGKLEQ